MSQALAGRVALVTGGTKGIGRAIVKRFAAEGARVFHCAPDDDGAESLAKEATRDGGAAPVFVRADIGSPSQLERFIHRAGRDSGRIDIIVNNAAIGGFKTAEDLTLEEWTRVWDVNVRSCWLTAKHGWKYLKASGSASIITISSVHASHTSPACIPYGATKAAVVALMRTMAVDGGPFGIRANSICPGLIRTDANAADFEGAAGRARHARAQVNEALGRIGLPGDVAGAAAFLAGPESSFITGSEIFVDGGAHARLYGNVYEEERRASRRKGRRR